MNIIGKTSTHPILFYTGKTCSYFCWLIYVLTFFGIININMLSASYFAYVSYITVLLGLIFTSISLLNLGKSTRLGLPDEKTVFKDIGIYKISRNPMYVGFNLLTISSMLISINIIIIILGVYSIIVYHLIILGEESFLEKRFGQTYVDYKNKVRRYF